MTDMKRTRTKHAVKTQKRPGKAGRPSYKPSDEHRTTVEMMAAVGIPQPMIAEVMGMSQPTLRKHFRMELDQGAVKMITKVGASLYQQAMNGSVAAAIFIMKTRAGWSERVDPKQPELGKKEQLVLDAQHPPEGSKWQNLLN